MPGVTTGSVHHRYRPPTRRLTLHGRGRRWPLPARRSWQHDTSGTRSSWPTPANPHAANTRSANTRWRRHIAEQQVRGRRAARWLLAALYLVAGLFHLSTPQTFLLITPDWVPWPRQVIFLTGLCEIAGALGLLTRRLRRAAGAGLALYAVCVFPANIRHAFVGLPPGQLQLGWWYHAPRLALQPVIVWWALFAGELTDWPFRRRRRSA